MRSVRLVVVGALAASVWLGCSKKENVSAPTGPIAVTADEKGFTPSSVTVKKGAPATLVFTRTTDDTCATAVVFPELNVKKDLPKGQPVSITVPTDKERTLSFECGMGMFKSSVVVKSD